MDGWVDGRVSGWVLCLLVLHDMIEWEMGSN